MAGKEDKKNVVWMFDRQTGPYLHTGENKVKLFPNTYLQYSTLINSNTKCFQLVSTIPNRSIHQKNTVYRFKIEVSHNI